MIRATARVLKNVIEIEVGTETWTGRPVESEAPGWRPKIAALFSTEYVLDRPQTATDGRSLVSYRAKSDEIRIQVGEDQWKTKSTTFGPMTVVYAGVEYTINERLTGKFAVLRGSEPVGVGQLGFRSCVIEQYPPALEVFLAHLALGYVVRTLTWEMFG
ncbi:MAG TPA: hypothetical protein VEH28_06245 [Thermoplasmata archaeon]|nr:hypothetical protein [Thermoplasmata archaeon]